MKFVTKVKRMKLGPFFFMFVVFCMLLFVIGLSRHNRRSKQNGVDVFSSLEQDIEGLFNDSAYSNNDDKERLAMVTDQPLSLEANDGAEEEEMENPGELHESLPKLEVGQKEEHSAENTEFQNVLQASTSSLFAVMANTPSGQIQSALAKERVAIEKSLQDYGSEEFELSKYTIEKGGTPIRNIIFTTWRSGSTFLGEAITSHPGLFYHYEPLLHFEIVQVRSEPLATEGLRVIKNLLECNYTELQQYINYGKSHLHVHTHNFRLWKHCQRKPGLCNDHNFLSKMCQIFPFQIMKTVRMRLRYAEPLLQDDKLDVRIVFLVRDPRGTMQSRNHRDWCPQNADCYEPTNLCSDMTDDYQAAVYLREKFPGKVLLVRYEDLSTNPYNGVKRVLDFYRLTFHPLVSEFIKTHTVNTKGGVSSTFRDSKTTPFQWIKYFAELGKANELSYIQEKCSAAMQLWGYAPLDPRANNTDFIPLLEPPWEDMVIPQDDVDK